MLNSDTRTRILNSAIDLFDEHGYTKASMREISKSANIALSVSYNYFEDKTDILFHIISKIGNDLVSELDNALSNNKPGIQSLRAMIVAQLLLIRERKKEINIFMQDQFLLPPPLKNIIKSQQKNIYSKYYKQIQAIERDGMLNKLNKTVLTFSIIAMVTWAYRWYKTDGGLHVNDIADEMIKMTLCGIINDSHRDTYGCGLQSDEP